MGLLRSDADHLVCVALVTGKVLSLRPRCFSSNLLAPSRNLVCGKEMTSRTVREMSGGKSKWVEFYNIKGKLLP